jgi:alkaline phosphatase
VSWPLPTDSAAAATAMATGTRVSNGVLSVAIPGDRRNLQTLLEYFKTAGKRTGLVTTSFMTDATPAGFAAHAINRGMTSSIARCYLNQSKPDILYGGGGCGLRPSAAEQAGYVVVTNRSGMVSRDSATPALISGQFGIGSMPYEYDGMKQMPHLSEMASNALAIVEHNSSGFFLMVEGGLIDHACHTNDTARMIMEMLEFDKAIQIVEEWATNRTDTLLVVTADHETGGMKVLGTKGAGSMPRVSWKTRGHTGAGVGLWAWGANSSFFSGQMANTNLFQAIIKAGTAASNQRG